MKHYIILVVALITISCPGLFSQESSSHTTEQADPKVYFEPFEGTVYTLPYISRKNGKITSKGIPQYYNKNVTDYDSLTYITLKEINIPETTIGLGEFPGVDRTTRFCMLLQSRAFIKEAGCYEFTLESDDGSILWFNNSEIVNNDGGHQMTLKRDSVSLKRGEYKVKLWYFQGHPDRFGLKLNSKYIHADSLCQALPSSLTKEIKSDQLFGSGEFVLTETANSKLNDILNEFSLSKLDSISVIGHTDNVGSKQYNDHLSYQRAQSVATKIAQLMQKTSVPIRSFGKGENEPLEANDSEEGRKKNRRVEIIFHLH